MSDVDSIRDSESQCSISAGIQLGQQCKTISTGVTLLTYGPFKDLPEATNFRDNFLIKTETYFKDFASIASTPAPSTPGIPAECRTGSRRDTVEVSPLIVDKAIGEASCSCHDFLKVIIFVSEGPYCKARSLD
jgi:hypothetical protein